MSDTFRLMHECYNPFPSEPSFVFDKWLPQILAFAREIYPTLESYVKDYPTNSNISLLDVGGAIGAGTEFFRARLQRFVTAQMGKSSRIEATILETDLQCKEWAEHFCPKCKFINDSIFDITLKYDFVIASHVIEHIFEPFDFIHKMQTLAKDKVIIYAPYNETLPPEHISSARHVTSITMELIESLSPIEVKLITSAGWGGDNGCILAVLSGKNSI